MNLKNKFLIFLLALFLVASVQFFFNFHNKKINAQYSGGSGGGSASSVPTSSGTPTSGPFGGKIINTKASEIAMLEGMGYICYTPGESIEITPIKGPSSYLIPSGTSSKTGFPLSPSQWIIGLYGNPTTIICILPGDPPTTQYVNLNTITLFGNSQN